MRATRQHATSLASFVAIYKSLLLLQKKLNGGKAKSSDTFFAGLAGGYLVFGDRNAINEQVRNFLMFDCALTRLADCALRCFASPCLLHSTRFVVPRPIAFHDWCKQAEVDTTRRSLLCYIRSRVLGRCYVAL